MRALAGSDMEIKGLSVANDTKVLSEALAHPFRKHHIEDGGTSFRFLLAYLASLEGYAGELSAGSRLKERPQQPLVKALRACGADIEGEKPPYRINGKKLEGGEVSMDGSMSSQFASALLMVAPTMEQGLKLTTEYPVSETYLKMTVDLMKSCGIDVHQDDTTYEVKPGKYTCEHTAVEPDWSSAAIWAGLVVQSPGLEITLPGLQKNSLQGDARVIDAMAPLGLRAKWDEEGVTLWCEPDHVQSLTFDVKGTPDLALPLVAASLGRGMEITLTGIQTLSLKESNRLTGLQMLVEATGGTFELEEHGIRLVPGTKDEKKTPCGVYSDHRMAFAWSILLPRFGSMEIEHEEVAKKSYPQFWEHLQSIGVRLG